MSGIVNCSVVRRGRVVYPRKIHSITVPGISVSKYYYDVIHPEISSISNLTKWRISTLWGIFGQVERQTWCYWFSLASWRCCRDLWSFSKICSTWRRSKTKRATLFGFWYHDESAERGRLQKEVDSKALPARKPENNSKDRLYNALLTFFWRLSS